MQDLQQPTLGRYGQPSLAGTLARQRQDDIARTAEQRRVVTVALAGSLDNARATRVARGHTVSTLQAGLARALRHRPVASRTSVTVACHA